MSSNNNSPHDPQTLWSVRESRYPIPKQPDPWNTCLKVLVEEDEARCNAWRSEMQNILTFAGLFSAVVTGFVIDSYKSLQPDPSETTNFLLAQLVSQSKGQSSPPPFVVAASSSRVNVFWFISLILALAAALVGITAMQWLNEYQRYSGNLTKKENFAQRHMRFEGLERWYVPQIIAGLPLLLQSALVLFFVGLVDFLISLGDRALTITVTLVVAIILLFMIITTVLPASQCIWFQFVVYRTSVSPPCPYKSAQSWAFLCIALSDVAQAVMCIVCILLPACVRWRKLECRTFSATQFSSGKSWDNVEHDWLRMRSSQSFQDDEGFLQPERDCSFDTALGLAYLVKQYVLDSDAACAAYNCFKQLDLSVVGSPFFSTFKDGEKDYRGLVSHAIAANTQTSIAKDEYGILFLRQLPQTHPDATDLEHILVKHELELYIRICAFLYLEREGFNISSNVVEGGISLLVPRSLTGIWGEHISRGFIFSLKQDYKMVGEDKIYKFVGTAEKLQLLYIFISFVDNVISKPQPNDGAITKFYIEGTLLNFVHSINCILLDAVMSLPPGSSSSPTTLDQGQGKAISEFSQLIHKLATHLETAQPSHSHLALSIAMIHLSLFRLRSDMARFVRLVSKRQPGYAKGVIAMYNAFQLFRGRFGDDAMPPIRGYTYDNSNIGSAIMEALPEDEKHEWLGEKGDGGTSEQDIQQASSSQLAPKLSMNHNLASHDPSNMV